MSLEYTTFSAVSGVGSCSKDQTPFLIWWYFSDCSE